MSTTAPTTSPVAVGTWNVDPVHSRIGFSVQHFGLTWIRGHFPSPTGTLKVAPDGGYTIEGGADVAGVSFTAEQLVGHLMSPDFFDAQLHPRITFSATDVALDGSGDVTVRGELAMRGTTKPIELRGTWRGPVEDMGGQQRIGVELAGELDRYDYGVAWDAKLGDGTPVVGATVRLSAEFELVLG